MVIKLIEFSGYACFVGAAAGVDWRLALAVAGTVLVNYSLGGRR